MTFAYITCHECGELVSFREYGSYCPSHRLDANGCCRNHCLIDEEGGHCIHCTPNQSSIHCGFCGRASLETICEACNESEASYDDIPDLIEEDDSVEQQVENFHGFYQFIAPTREEQMERLSTLNIQLCEECQMPCENIRCKDCQI
ncbi:5212_t:CDS:1 [Paraglomus brasilianum]|uniref:5212_t:CDS:1 n=1 Tax=Paraglomus brasilianum TaxID=144538 RepID=A0A9N9CXZ2_9GLOM|nr:5212_t:CDS:1 [Paraglomus brasilianum]